MANDGCCLSFWSLLNLFDGHLLSKVRLDGRHQTQAVDQSKGRRRGPGRRFQTW